MDHLIPICYLNSIGIGTGSRPLSPNVLSLHNKEDGQYNRPFSPNMFHFTIKGQAVNGPRNPCVLSPNSKDVGMGHDAVLFMCKAIFSQCDIRIVR